MDDPQSEETFNINDFSSDLNSNKEKKENNMKKYIIIGGLIIIIIILIIVIIILVNNSPDNSKKDDDIPKNVIGEINCLYEIETITNKTLILGKQFNNDFNFSIVIDGEIINNNIKEYLFT